MSLTFGDQMFEAEHFTYFLMLDSKLFQLFNININHTPPKTDMTLENQLFESMYLLLQNGDFPNARLVFGGGIFYSGCLLPCRVTQVTRQ